MSHQSSPFIVHTNEDLKEFLDLRDYIQAHGRANGVDEATIQQQTAHLEPFTFILPDSHKPTTSNIPQQPTSATQQQFAAPSRPNFAPRR